MKRVIHKFFVTFLFLLPWINAFSQFEAEALRIYKEGVKQFRAENYRAADSLFTSSLALHITAKTYFGRGAARYNFSNVRGYCADMSKASYYGDTLANKQFASKCIIIDTMYNNTEKSLAKLSKQVVFLEFTRGIYNDIAIVKPYDKKGKVMGEFFIYKKDTTFTKFVVQENNPYPVAGFNRLTTYFLNETKYTAAAKAKGITGTVLIECIVNKDGSVDKIKVGRGIGYGCDEEALRVVNGMGKWTNGSFLDKPVKSLVELSISFPPK